MVRKAEHRLAKFAVAENWMRTNSDDASGRELQDATRSQTIAPESLVWHTRRLLTTYFRN
jgi:hypothetical protein